MGITMTGMASQVPHVFQWPNGEMPTKYGIIEGFSIVVGRLFAETTFFDDSGFHPRWTTRLFWTLDIFFSCITGVVGILRVGAVGNDRWIGGRCCWLS